MPLPLTVTVSVSTDSAARIVQREGDRAGRVIAAGERRPVVQRRRAVLPSVTVVGLAVVVIVGLAGLTVTGSLRLGAR